MGIDEIIVKEKLKQNGLSVLVTTPKMSETPLQVLDLVSTYIEDFLNIHKKSNEEKINENDKLFRLRSLWHDKGENTGIYAVICPKYSQRIYKSTYDNREDLLDHGMKDSLGIVTVIFHKTKRAYFDRDFDADYAVSNKLRHNPYRLSIYFNPRFNTVAYQARLGQSNGNERTHKSGMNFKGKILREKLAQKIERKSLYLCEQIHF